MRQLRFDITTSSRLSLCLETRSAINHEYCGAAEPGCFDGENSYDEHAKQLGKRARNTIERTLEMRERIRSEKASDLRRGLGTLLERPQGALRQYAHRVAELVSAKSLSRTHLLPT